MIGTPPPSIFKAIGLHFDLDPCSPGAEHWVPAGAVYTKADDGLRRKWSGLVFMNPPFGGRNGHVPWLDKFLKHGDGIAIVRAYTSSAWWHENMPRAHGILFPRGKTKFIRPDGSIGKSPGHGIVLVAMGKRSCDALRNSGLGMYWDLQVARDDRAAPIADPNAFEHVKRKPLTKLQKAKMFAEHKGICCICHEQIDAVREGGFIDEHIVALELGGTNDMSNRGPAHIGCARKKTARDHREAAKGKRIYANRIGAKSDRKKAMPHGRNSPTKRKMNGQVVARRA